MPDFNKGDFTQQGVNGHVRTTLRLNEKRYVELDLTTNENARGCTISGNVHDRLNNLDYPIGAAPSGGGMETAEVTFINSGGADTYYYLTNFIRINQEDKLVYDNAEEYVSSEIIVTLPLYNGSYIFSLQSLGHENTQVLPSATGNITIDLENEYFEITGDGTITLAGRAGHIG